MIDRESCPKLQQHLHQAQARVPESGPNMSQDHPEPTAAITLTEGSMTVCSHPEDTSAAHLQDSNSSPHHCFGTSDLGCGQVRSSCWKNACMLLQSPHVTPLCYGCPYKHLCTHADCAKRGGCLQAFTFFTAVQRICMVAAALAAVWATASAAMGLGLRNPRFTLAVLASVAGMPFIA